MYRTFDHTADLGLHIEAATFAEIIAEAGRALGSILVGDLATVQPREERTLAVSGTEHDLLLFDWLTELLYLYDTERFLCRDFNVRQTPTGLEISCRGEPVDPARHRLEHEVKAVTYHGLFVARSATGFAAEVIVDI